MWMIALLFGALFLGLAKIGERRARLLVIPLVLAVIGFQSLKYGLL